LCFVTSCTSKILKFSFGLMVMIWEKQKSERWKYYFCFLFFLSGSD
jgi:hypothetical protein